MLLTYLLTPRSTVLLEKRIGFLIVKKFPTIYGTRRFITAFTSGRHLSLSSARSIPSVPPYTTSWRPILTLSSHQRLGLPSGLFPSGFPTKTMYKTILPHTCYMHRPSRSSRSDHPNNIGWGVQVIQVLHFLVFCTPLLPRPSWAQISSSEPYSQTPSAYVPPSMWATSF